MLRTKCIVLSLPWLVIIATAAQPDVIRIQVSKERPVVDGVFVNGKGPYRFLIDTGSNINLIETGVAEKLRMTATRGTFGAVPPSRSET